MFIIQRERSAAHCGLNWNSLSFLEILGFFKVYDALCCAEDFFLGISFTEMLITFDALQLWLDALLCLFMPCHNFYWLTLCSGLRFSESMSSFFSRAYFRFVKLFLRGLRMLSGWC